MPEPTPRDDLAYLIEHEADPVSELARATLAALDAHAHDLAALVARLDAIEHIDQGCAACGEPDAAHPIDTDRAEDWQPQHRYIEPDPNVPRDWPVIPLPAGYPDATTLATCGACGRSWDDDFITSMTPAPSGRCPFEPFHEDDDQADAEHAEAMHRALTARQAEPTGADIETGRDLANDAEQYGAESDARDVAHMIAQAIAAARAEGYQAGYDAGRLTSGSLPR